MTTLSLALAALMTLMTPALAQSGKFAPAIIVNDSVVTQYELDQRIRFLTILRAPGDVVAEAEKGLTEDRLRSQAAKAAGITPNDQQIAAGMAEFASRANLDTEQFLQAIGQAGIAPETFRDFVSAGLAWREVVRGRFGPRVSISEAEIDRAMSVAAQRGAGPRVLMSEILIPMNPGNAAEIRDLATELSGTIRSDAAFAAAARQYSAAPSRAEGGQLDWIPLTNLPPQVRQIIAGLANGQVSPPVPLGNAMGLFRLRGLQQGGEISAANISVDYAQLLIAGGRTPEALAMAEQVRGEVDTCDDLYRVAKGRPAGELLRETRPLGQVPADIAAELARLDDNESSTALTRGNALVFLMLCKRSATLAAGSAPVVTDVSAPTGDGVPAIDPALGFGQGPSRAQVREELVNQRLAGFADGYLAELRANAIIRTP
ncbi:peptidylprolyl isomerase [Defluviimonas sp. SAOS-178_SWC]|uniref:peptidylprolyl isomerase n=1 Tax=Defluviimonas sp. SAOS-178_SWC TaxID=3121287 RepID=UPI003221F8F5